MMKRILLYSLSILSAAAGLIGCQQKFAVINELSVSSHTLNLKSEAGSTHIMVYSDGPWSVRLDRAIEWGSLNKLSGEGLNDFVFSWSANYGIARAVKILIDRDGKTETISILQAGSITSPGMTFERNVITLPKQGTVFSMPMQTNLTFCLDEIKARVVYYGPDGSESESREIGAGEGAWVTGYSVEADKVSFTVTENTGGADRKADLIYYVKDASGAESRSTITLTQSRLDPTFTLSANSGSYYANDNTYSVPTTSNNIWASPETVVSASGDWITAASVDADGLSFTVTENTGGAVRNATVTVAYVKGGHSAGATYSLTQSADKVISFSEVRDWEPGALSSNDYIEGYIISDPSSANVCSSPQTGQFAFDRTENARTAYIESLDGNYGFCLKFTAADQNTLERWSHVLIRLNGVTLVKEEEPLRYTLTGLTSAKFVVVESGTAGSVPQKIRTISQLSDNDLYTYVSLSPVEIMCKDGCFTNASEGYALGADGDASNPSGSETPRWDVAPLLCSDADGAVIHMLTNAAVPWRRTGEDLAWNTCVPQGSGVLSGIIVSDDVAPVRWGDLGRYQIRAMTREEIDLEGPRFSNTIVEWNWNEEMTSISLNPSEGHGSFNKHNASAKFSSDFNNPYKPTDKTAPNGRNETTNMKGLVENAAVTLEQQWWDFSANEGKYFDVKFSTAGLSGTNLVVGLTWGHGSMNTATVTGPAHWNVLYSTANGEDGSFQPVPSVEILKKRSIVWWTTTSQDACPGLTEHLIKLPASCFGKSNVVIRFQVADTVTDIVPSTSASTWKTALGCEKGSLSSSVSAANCQVRIGTLTVRYN